MGVALMFISMGILLAIGVPLAVGLTLPIFLLLAFNPVTTTSFVAQTFYSAVSSFTLLALPFFMVAGSIMDSGGLSKRLVNVANAMIGGITGSLGTVTVVACMFFGAVSGSAPATVAAIGTIMIPQMIRAGYDKYYATGLCAVAGGLGVIVPPSYPMVVYGVTNNVSIGDLFICGIIPSFVVGFLLIAFNYVHCRKYGLKGTNKFNFQDFIKALWDAKFALLMPVIILGGIYSGIVTTTEAAVVATVYGIIIGLFGHKELKISALENMFRDNAIFVAGVMLIMAPASALGKIFAYLGVNQTVANLLFSFTTNKYVIFILIFIVLFVAGMFIQTTPMIVIFSPVMLSVLEQVGVSPLHFGIVMVLALCIAFVTPPVAMNLFVASSMTGISLEMIAKKATPFIIGLIIAFFVIAFVPALSLC